MNSLSEIQNKPNTAPSSNGFGVLADEIVANTPAGTTIAKLNSTDITSDTVQINTQLQSTGKAIFNSIRIPEWQPGYYYQIGEIFRRGHSIYFVDIAHTSQSDSADFYIDWLVNKNVRPMGRHPGQVVNLVNAGTDPGSNALAADGSEYNITGKEDLYRYLNYGYTPTTVTFDAADVSNSGGYIQINKTAHGLYDGQVVEVIKGSGGGDFSNTLQTLFVRRIDANSFQLSTLAHSQVTTGITVVINYSGTPFIGTGHTVITRLWGVPSAPTKFRVPDFRGLFLAVSGQNNLIRKYTGTLTYNRTYGSYMYDTGLDHTHNYYISDGLTAQWAGENWNPQYVPSSFTPTGGSNRPRSNENEHAPAHAVVNCYILY